MHYLLFIVLFIINVNAHAMELRLVNIEDYSKDKQNFSYLKNGQQEFYYSLTIKNQKDLQKFYCLSSAHVSDISKISIYLQDVTQVDRDYFKKFFEAHRWAFTKLRVFISSGLELGDDFAKLLSDISQLTEVDLIKAGLTNDGLTYLLNAENLLHINVTGNTDINEIIWEIPSKKRCLILFLNGTSLLIDADLDQMLNQKGVSLFF